MADSDRDEANCIADQLANIAVRFELSSSLTKAILSGMDPHDIMNFCAHSLNDITLAVEQARVHHRAHAKSKAKSHLTVVAPVIKGAFGKKSSKKDSKS